MVLAYLAGAWALLQGLDFVGDQFGWPADVSRVALVLLAAGLLLVVVLAWFHGEQGRQKATVAEVVFVSVVLIVAVIGVAFVRSDPAANAPPVAESAAPKVEPGSIAVLPFTNLSGDQANEYFSDGISEEILNALARVAGLRVTSRTSSFSFRGENIAIDEVARRLRVAHVLEGSVRRMKDSVRITATLIDARNDRQLWSQDFDRNLRDVFAVQAEIAREIARALEVRLAATVSRTVPTENPRAHELYLRGLSEWHRRTPGALAAAIEHFSAALREDSLYADAWAGLALAHQAQPVYDLSLDALESMRVALRAARRAEALDSALAQAHTALGLLIVRDEYRWEEGLAELKRGVELNPSDGIARAYYGSSLGQLGRFDEALQQLDQATELDPLSPFAHMFRGIALFQAGRTRDASAALQLAISLEPNHMNAASNLARVYITAGHYDSAQTHLTRTAELFGYARPDETRAFTSALRDGKTEEARRILANWERTRPFQFYTLAVFYAATRDRDGTLRTLKRSVSRHEPAVLFLRSDPSFSWLRSDPEYRRAPASLSVP